MMKEFYFYSLMKKKEESVSCLISAQLEGTLKVIRRGKGEEGKKSHGLIFVYIPFIVRLHIYYIVNKGY